MGAIRDKIPLEESKSIIRVPMAHLQSAGMLFFLALCSPKMGKNSACSGSISMRFDLQSHTGHISIEGISRKIGGKIGSIPSKNREQIGRIYGKNRGQNRPKLF